MKLLPVSEWFGEWVQGPLYIAGPCSAESKEQLLATASELTGKARPHIFRAGVWKPRTRPGSFNGVGTEGLKWLVEAGLAYGMRTATEAATGNHVEACLKAGVDIIWIGARTVSNPFSVDEIAEALRGVEIPVLIKNPLNPDLDLWIGAIERVSRSGITRMAAVHRGFSPFERTRYRNMPKWEIPIELRRRYRKLPIICDPSHIAGDTRYVKEIAQKAMDMNLDGLMTEVHNDPSRALSDAAQQLTPVAYRRMISGLVVRKAVADDPGFLNHLEEMRSQVDSVDHQLLELIARRMELSDQIGEYKCINNVAVLQMERWLEILRTRLGQAADSGLDRNFTEALLKLIHQESIRRQTGVMSRMKAKGKCLSGSNGVGDGDNNVDNDNKRKGCHPGKDKKKN
jgi:chorismate mutase